MIKLEHVTKYYYKNRANQFAVCNDISLTFENTGLVVILGASGSGKTTLLNVISGMDKFDKGRLIFDDIIFEKYSHRLWDNIRKHKIGYVYQNYHLLKDSSVYQNIEPILKMQGITDASVIAEHIDRLLSAVGLSSYGDRLVKQLSGGQQQRIAFARALANNPEVILADEPTGNLDGKTTIELMNVIKEISKTRLVIMVTHEQALCDYYADRIIMIENGIIIKDALNDQQQSLDLIQEHIINLYDYQKTTLKTSQLNISRYTNKLEPTEMDIDLIERNQTLYIKVNSGKLKRTKYIDSDSEIIIRDTPLENNQNENPFDIDDMYPQKTNETSKNVFGWKDIFRYAFKKLNVFHGGSKMLFVVLMLVGIIISVSVGLIGEIYYVEEPYSTIDSNYITVYMDNTSYNDVPILESVPGVEQVMYVNEPYMFTVGTTSYYEVASTIRVSAQPIDIRFFDETTLLYGSIPTNYGIIIDISVADEIIKNNQTRGIKNYNDVLSCYFKIRTSGTDASLSIDSSLSFNISGIASGNSKSVWMNEELLYSFVTPSLIDYHILGDNFHIVSGSLPTSQNYAMINNQYPTVLDGKIPYNIGTSTGTYYISGIYEYNVDGVSYDFQKAMVTSTEYIKDKFYLYSFHQYNDFSLLVYTDDVESTLLALDEAGFIATGNNYQPSVAQQAKLDQNKNLYLLGIGGILMGAFSILLIMRSSLISRIYEVSVYRSIGISRKEIRRIFILEILLTTTFSSVVGFILMLLLLNTAQSTIEAISVTRFTGLSISLVIVGLYVINLIFGLIPINILLRKTPSNIMKQSDL
ncbi:MAG: ABC transporter ATP-binding protein/permease [Acholeplasmataceae bacterium]